MGKEDEPSMSALQNRPSHLYLKLKILTVTETYRYNETPTYTTSNGCPVRTSKPSTKIPNPNLICRYSIPNPRSELARMALFSCKTFT